MKVEGAPNRDGLLSPAPVPGSTGSDLEYTVKAVLVISLHKAPFRKQPKGTSKEKSLHEATEGGEGGKARSQGELPLMGSKV